jgi:hypothetical protein
VYAGGDPVNHTDPTGLIDPSAVVDIGFILLDLHNLFTGGRKDLGENLAALGLDVLGLLIPIVTGLGAAGRHLDDVDDIGTLGRLGRFCNCFPPGTPILTSEGEKPIEDIQVGDLVYSTDPETGEQSYQPVTGLYQRDGADLITVTTYQGDFQVTGPHPLWVQAKGWTKAQDLTPGDRLLKADGTTVTVTQTGPGPANATIYNLAVNHNHNYYATPQTLLTHNCPAPRVPDPTGISSRAKPHFTDPSISPGPGWEWLPRGSPPGEVPGAWHNPISKESLHPDLINPVHGPHYDYTGPWKRGEWRRYPDGTFEPK